MATPVNSSELTFMASSHRRAVIDVGTNSVKVLLAEVFGSTVEPVWETSEQTRLGAGFYDDHRLRAGPIAATADAVARFAREARKRGAATVRVLATSAAREAVNADELLGAIRTASGLETEVIAGDMEAEMGFRGVTTHPWVKVGKVLVLDVGGGSTEFMFGVEGRLVFRRSFPIGSVRLFEKLQLSDPPGDIGLNEVEKWLLAWLELEVAPHLQPVFEVEGNPELAVGIGGTTSILALIHQGRHEFDRVLIERTLFQAKEFHALTRHLWSLPLSERRTLPGLPPERADVILTGAAIYSVVLHLFRIPRLIANTRGLRYAAVMESPHSAAGTIS